jgi:outer membrane receptor protein involved in Fe transport
MKLLWLLLLILFVTKMASSQATDGLTVSGTIHDENNTPIPFANAAMFNQADTTLAGGAVSDDNGNFTVKLVPGKYFLKITFLSYEEKTISNINLIDRNINLGTITLRSDTRLLKEVEVRGEKSQMELQLDKRVFNVGKDLSNIGGNASDILANIPSVSVDVDGRVSLRGSENVRILINGKPSGLTSRDPDALRHLQGNMVERVEVITNPSSRYDAAGEVGIINIVLKKEQTKGINGTFTGNLGYPDFYGAAYSVNMRRKKINFFSSYGMDYRKSPGYARSFTNFLKNDSSYSQNTDRTRAELSHNVTAGVDYFINEYNTITGSVMYNIGDGDNRSTVVYTDFLSNQIINNSTRTDHEKEDEENIEGSLNYTRSFKQKGRELTLDLKYIKSADDEESDYKQTSTNSAEIIQHAINLAREKNWLIQTDYIHSLSKDGKFETGLKTATRIINNEYALEQLQAEGNWEAAPAFNNNMIYTERIHAAYVMAGNKFNKLSLQAGLRAEYSDITTELTETNQVNHREYFNIFPSMNLGYELKENKSLQLSYSYRISRPEFRDLLPFSDFTDTRSFFVGNPDLNPEYTHSFEAGYLLNWESGSILSSAYYRYRKGVIQRITEFDEMGIANIIPINLAIENAYGLEFNFSLNVEKWLQLNSNANFYRAITEGSYKEEQLFSDNYSFNNRTTAKLTLFKTLDFQASFNYRAPRVTPQGKQLSIYSVDLGLSKDIFKGKGTITANVRDLFNSRIMRSIVSVEDFYSESSNQRRMRQFMLTLSYRLNRNKEREIRNNEGGGNGEEEY